MGTSRLKSHHPLVLFFLCLVALRCCIMVLRVALPFDLPHLWRQIDTLGVCIRYWLRWQSEALTWQSLLPAVLNSGTSSGITPMEFPLLGLSLAPFFSFGPFWGVKLASLALYLSNTVLTFHAAYLWRRRLVQGVPMELVCLGYIILSVSASYFLKFMPDYLSFILCFLALSGALLKGWTVRALLLASIGLLLKPTTVVVFAFAMVVPDFWQRICKHLLWMLLATGIALLYYTKGLGFIRTYQDGVELFKVTLASPPLNFLEFVSQPREISKLLGEKLLFIPGIFAIVVALPFLSRTRRKNLLITLGLIILQVGTIALLDGGHSFIHEYYFIGCAPLLGLMVFQLYFGFREHQYPVVRKCAWLLVLLGLVGLGKNLEFDLRTLFPRFHQRYLDPMDCDKVKLLTPQLPWGKNFVFRSHGFPYPEAGICFFEREGDAGSRYGIFSAQHPLPADCSLIIAQVGNALVAACSGEEEQLQEQKEK